MSTDRLRGKTFLLGGIASALPFLLIGLIELGLRVAGVDSERQHPFVAVEGHPDYRVFNPVFPERYFQTFAPAIAFNPFTTTKHPETFRIVALGGSSTIGFPYAFYSSFPAQLERRLQRYSVGQRIEVINLGMTAVNSFTIWDLADEVVDLNPDAVIIYAGHNEYYGAFGSGSTEYGVGNAIWPKRLLLRLKSFVFFRLVEDLILGDRRKTERSPNSRTLMARIVRDSGITFGRDVFNAGLTQFERNIGSTLSIFSEAGIPTFIGTLASNLADQPPLGDAPDALAAFHRGQRFLADGDSIAALAQFISARDLDNIRFRAADTLSAVIERLAVQHGATVVDVGNRLASESEAHITGRDLFDDHLHPNLLGYALIADEFFAALLDHSSLRRNPLADWKELQPQSDSINLVQAGLQIARLKGGYPFDKEVDAQTEHDNFETLVSEHRKSAKWPYSLGVDMLTQRVSQQEALQQGVRMARATADTAAAMLVSQSLLYWQPFNETLMNDFVAYANGNPHFDGATARLALQCYNLTGTPFFLSTAGAVALRQGRHNDAEVFLEIVESVDAYDEAMLYNYARLHVMRGDTMKARLYFERLQQVRQ